MELICQELALKYEEKTQIIKYLWYMEKFSGKEELEPDDYYLTPEGYKVFTEKYLLKRGYCCQNGCRHCPYGFNKSKGRIEKKQ